MELKNCYFCGNTVHPGQGFVKQGVTFCSLRCQQQVPAADIRQQQQAAELGGCLGTVGAIIRRIVGVGAVGFLLFFLGVKACSSGTETPPPVVSELELGSEEEPAIEPEPSPALPPEPLAPTPAPATEKPPNETVADTSGLPTVLDLLEAGQP